MADMRWAVHGERVIYDSPWVRLALVDVEIPGGNRFEHHVIRSAHPAVGVVVRDPDRGVLRSTVTGSSPMLGAGRYRPVAWNRGNRSKQRPSERCLRRRDGGPADFEGW